MNYKDFKEKYYRKHKQLKEQRENVSPIQKRIDNILLSIIIIFLSIHLFTIHSKLLFHINPDKIISELTYKFSMYLFSEGLIVSTLSALGYSLITAFILTIFVKYKDVFLISVISFAILDGLGVFIYYNVHIQQDTLTILGSIYYSIYTLFIVISVGYFRHLEYSNNDNLEYRVDQAIQETDIMNMREKIVNMTNNSENIQSDIVNNTDEYIVYLSNKGLTQTEIAEKLKISQPKVSRILSKARKSE